MAIFFFFFITNMVIFVWSSFRHAPSIVHMHATGGIDKHWTKLGVIYNGSGWTWTSYRGKWHLPSGNTHYNHLLASSGLQVGCQCSSVHSNMWLPGLIKQHVTLSCTSNLTKWAHSTNSVEPDITGLFVTVSCDHVTEVWIHDFFSSLFYLQNY
jgi:hypothetical protein